MNDVQSILDKQESFVIKSINHLHIDYLTTNYINIFSLFFENLANKQGISSLNTHTLLIDLSQFTCTNILNGNPRVFENYSDFLCILHK